MAEKIEIKSWQREVGKVNLKENERGFVLPDGRVIATNTADPKFKEYSKKRGEEKYKKRQDAVNERLAKQKKKMEDKVKRESDRAAKKKAKETERLVKKQKKITELEKELEKEKMQIEAKLQA